MLISDDIIAFICQSKSDNKESVSNKRFPYEFGNV